MPLDSTGKGIVVGDRVKFRGEEYTIKEFLLGKGSGGTSQIEFEEPQHIQEIADEASVDRIMSDRFKEICGNCGLTFGSHHGGDYYSEKLKKNISYNYCPGHEGRMDWGEGPGTVFKSTDTYKLIPYNTPSKGGD